MQVTTDKKITFGEWIGFKMYECGYRNDMALATELGVSHATISRWKNNKAIPDVEQLRRLAPLLRTPLPQLLILAGHASAEEMETAPVPTSSEDPVVRLIEQSTLSQEQKVKLIREWRRRQLREQSLMELHVRMVNREDQIRLKLDNVQEDNRNRWAEFVEDLFDSRKDPDAQSSPA